MPLNFTKYKSSLISFFFFGEHIFEKLVFLNCHTHVQYICPYVCLLTSISSLRLFSSQCDIIYLLLLQVADLDGFEVFYESESYRNS